MRIQRLISLGLGLIIFLTLAQSVHAADFFFDYQVYYSVAATGKTHVKQDITLTNNVTDYYANNYSLTVFTERIDDITAQDPGGSITPQVAKSNGQTVVTIPFNVKNVGVDKKFTFTLEYTTPDIAQKKGQIWELIIPGIEKTDEIRSYNVHMNVPPNFDKPAYITPPPGIDNIWSLDELNGGGISITYGTTQHYSFNLIYHLENTSANTQITEITLPPDTAFQKIVLNRLSVVPLQVRLDHDGNWLAQYQLQPKEKKKIIAEGSILVFSEPLSDFISDLTPKEKQLYISEQPYWDRTAEIEALGKKLKTPKAIYDYVVNTLSYDYDRIEPGIKRLGAISALNNPANSVCMEFSDLYIALARGAGIPSREIHGYAYATNSRIQPLSLVSDILHAWVEYYDVNRRLWIPIDPTWGNTTHGIDYFSKLDLNHIAFAILGDKSDAPFPAGSFKDSTGGKDVFVDFALNEIPIPEPQFQLSLTLAPLQLTGTKTNGSLHISNIGKVAYMPKQLSIDSSFPVDYDTSLLTSVPPYGSFDIPFTFTVPFALLDRQVKLTATLDKQQTSSVVSFQPFYHYYWLPLVLGSTVCLLFGILIFHGKRRT